MWTADRVPPHDLEAEKSALGAMLLNAEATSTGLSKLKTEDFYRPAHQRIFDAIGALFSKGEPCDVVTVASRLESTGEIDQVGGRTYLLDVVNTVPLAGNIAMYADIVKRMSLLRRLILASTHIAAMGYEAPDDVDEVIELAEKEIFDVTNERVETTFKPIEDLMADGWKRLEELYERQEHLTGVPTGWPDLDKVLAGLHRGDLIVLAARPSVGKTAFALNLAVNAAKEGTAVGIFSLEMSAEQLVMRILASESRVDGQKLRTGRLSDTDWKPLMDAMGRLDGLDLHVDDTPALSIMELRAKARRMFRGKKNGLIIVDYLQLMQPQGRRSENRQVEIAEISRGLKILAKELDLPVLALSQLSRAVEQRSDKRPMLSDLRECVSGDTLVALADGTRVPIETLVGTTPRVLAIDEAGRVVTADGDAVWPVGVRAVKRLTLASGRTIRATGRHRFLTGRGWVRLDEIEAGERVAVAHSIPVSASATEGISDDRIVLLAHMIGDGGYLPNRPMRYTTASEANSEAVMEAAQRGFGSHVSRHQGRGNWHQLVIAGNGNRWHHEGAGAWLRELGVFGQRSADKRVPEPVFRLADDKVALFLRHLWATNGTVWVPSKPGAGRRGHVFFTTCSRALADDVAFLLLRFGIVARIRTIVSKGSTRFTVTVSGAADQRRFLDGIGAFGPKERGARTLAAVLANVTPNTNADMLPREVFDVVREKMRAQGVTTRAAAAAHGTSYGGSSRFRFAPSRETVLEHARMLDSVELVRAATNDLFWDSVASVEDAGEAAVYDLTVPGPASWLADGVVSHNSGAIEQDSDVVMFIHRDVYKRDDDGFDDRGGGGRQLGKGLAEIIVAKHRNGPTDSVQLVYHEPYMRFVNPPSASAMGAIASANYTPEPPL